MHVLYSILGTIVVTLSDKMEASDPEIHKFKFENKPRLGE
jgi:hypothetical protein